MKEPTIAPMYVSLYPKIAKAAQANGYALAVHGSFVKDFDVVAVPWTDDAVSSRDLMYAIFDALRDNIPKPLHKFAMNRAPHTEQKPHGRVSYAIPLHGGAYLDLSITPRSSV